MLPIYPSPKPWLLVIIRPIRLLCKGHHEYFPVFDYTHRLFIPFPKVVPKDGDSINFWILNVHVNVHQPASFLWSFGLDGLGKHLSIMTPQLCFGYFYSEALESGAPLG